MNIARARRNRLFQTTEILIRALVYKCKKISNANAVLYGLPPEKGQLTETRPARLKELCGATQRGWGECLGYIFAGIVPLASQNAHLIQERMSSFSLASSQSILWPNNSPCLSQFSVREKETCDDFNLLTRRIQRMEEGNASPPPTLFLKLCNIYIPYAKIATVVS